MIDDNLDKAIAQLRAAGLNQAEARIAPFAAALVGMIPQMLSGQFAERARVAIASAKRTPLALTSADPVNQIAEDVDRNGVDVQLAPSPNAVKLNLKPNLVAFARGETSELTFDTIQLTETFNVDLGAAQHLAGAKLKTTITVTTTGTRNKDTGEYSMKSTGDIDLDVNSPLGQAST